MVPVRTKLYYIEDKNVHLVVILIHICKNPNRVEVREVLSGNFRQIDLSLLKEIELEYPIYAAIPSKGLKYAVAPIRSSNIEENLMEKSDGQKSN